MPTDAGQTGGFDPFNDRLSRDLRNTLSEALLAGVAQGSVAPCAAAAAAFRSHPGLTAAHAGYLEARLACYRAVIGALTPQADPDRVALLFWDHELFFEFHELLEKRWMAAQGEEKEILQGLIRAAGTFIHRGSGHAAGATKMASHARETITKYRERLPPGFGAEALLAALADPAAPPPKFGTLVPSGQNTCNHQGPPPG